MNLESLRNEIDRVDDEILALFITRMQLASDVADYKAQKQLATRNETREAEILDRIKHGAGEFSDYAEELFIKLFEISRAYQDAYRQS